MIAVFACIVLSLIVVAAIFMLREQEAVITALSGSNAELKSDLDAAEERAANTEQARKDAVTRLQQSESQLSATKAAHEANAPVRRLAKIAALLPCDPTRFAVISTGDGLVVVHFRNAEGKHVEYEIRF